MKQINLITNILDISGYSRHGRGLLNGLCNVYDNVRLDCRIGAEHNTELSDNEFKALNTKFDSNCVSVMIGMPQHWPFAISNRSDKFFGFCVWEGDKVPVSWIDNLRDERVDKILVPSKHTLNAIENTLIDLICPKSELNILMKKVEIVPHGYDKTKYYQDRKIKKNKTFTFIACKGWSKGSKDRGGLQYLFQAFKEEFTKKDNVQLIVKINPAYNNPNWNIMEEIKKLNLKGNAKMFTDHSIMNDKQLREFYNKGDVFVNTSMAEAFCLPIIESMACGVPVITTSFGGQADFVNKTNGWLLKKGRMGHYSDERMYENTRWKKPNIDEIRKTLRYAYDNRAEVRKKSAEALKTAENYTWDESAKKLVKLLSLF